MAKNTNEEYDDIIGGQMKSEEFEQPAAMSDAPIKKNSNFIVYAIMVPFIAVGGYIAAQSFGLLGSSDAPQQTQLLAASSDEGIITESPSTQADPVMDISQDPTMNTAQADAGIVLPPAGVVSGNEVVALPSMDVVVPAGVAEPSTATTTVTTTQVSTNPVTATEPIPSTQVTTTTVTPTVTPVTAPVVAASLNPAATNSPVLRDQAAVVDRLVTMSEKHDVMLGDVVSKMDNMQTMLAQIFSTISGKDYSASNNSSASALASNDVSTTSVASKPAKRKQRAKHSRAKKQAQKQVAVIEKPIEAIEVKKLVTIKSDDSYHTQVTIPGRAWVVGKDGAHSTVIVGDYLPNAGRVKSINVDTGEINIDNGRTIKMKSSE